MDVFLAYKTMSEKIEDLYYSNILGKEIRPSKNMLKLSTNFILTTELMVGSLEKNLEILKHKFRIDFSLEKDFN